MIGQTIPYSEKIEGKFHEDKVLHPSFNENDSKT